MTVAGKSKSSILTDSANPLMNAFRTGLLRGVGIDTADLAKRPLIAIVNSHSDLTAGHSHLANLGNKVREGILMAGGQAVEFNVPAPCDGVAMGHDGMRYVLAQRDLIADIVETHVRSQRFDGIVLIASCDKINPGMMMAAARLDMPAIYLAGGPGMMDIRNRTAFKGSIDHYDYAGDQTSGLASVTCATCGACEIMGTANTFQCLAEAMGICIPGSSNIPAYHGDKLIAARMTGQRIVGMVAEGMNFSQVLTPAALMNAVIVNIAIGGSTNATLHLPAIAHCAGHELPLAVFDSVAQRIPTMLAVSPNGPFGITDLWVAGGMPSVLKVLENDLDTSAMTVMGTPLSDVIAAARTGDPRVIPPRDQPVRPHGGIAVLTGNLAPDGAVIKIAGIASDAMVFSGPAICFSDEDSTIEAMIARRIPDGSVVIIRHAGPRGAPGMPEMLGVTTMMKTFGIKAALVTDGRYSGATTGICVGHVCPEAQAGGPIGAIDDGDMVTIDIGARTLSVALSDAEIAARLAGRPMVEHPVPRGFLERYRRHVGSAAKGAVLD
jgi:dihydroxy-acid dehydratase